MQSTQQPTLSYSKKKFPALLLQPCYTGNCSQANTLLGRSKLAAATHQQQAAHLQIWKNMFRIFSHKRIGQGPLTKLHAKKAGCDLISRGLSQKYGAHCMCVLRWGSVHEAWSQHLVCGASKVGRLIFSQSPQKANKPITSRKEME